MNDLVLYTPEQAAELLQLSKNTVYGLINRGEIVAKLAGQGVSDSPIFPIFCLHRAG